MTNQEFIDAYWGMIALIGVYFVQWAVATMVKASQPNAIPGKISETLGHDSFVFRSHRTFMNSQENAVIFLPTVMLAFFVQANPTWVAIWLWTYVVARILHMVLYYVISTDKNPSPRSYFFLIGVIANVGLFITTVMAI